MATYFGALEGNTPQRTIESTECSDGVWLVSGKFNFVLAGDPSASLSFSFEKAKDEHDALMQAARKLKIASDEFTRVAAAILVAP